MIFVIDCAGDEQRAFISTALMIIQPWLLDPADVEGMVQRALLPQDAEGSISQKGPTPLLNLAYAALVNIGDNSLPTVDTRTITK